MVKQRFVFALWQLLLALRVKLCELSRGWSQSETRDGVLAVDYIRNGISLFCHKSDKCNDRLTRSPSPSPSPSPPPPTTLRVFASSLFFLPSSPSPAHPFPPISGRRLSSSSILSFPSLHRFRLSDLASKRRLEPPALLVCSVRILSLPLHATIPLA